MSNKPTKEIKWNHERLSVNSREERKRGKRQQKNRKNKQKTSSKCIDLNLIISIITLNVNDLNTSIKRQSLRVNKKARTN